MDALDVQLNMRWIPSFSVRLKSITSVFVAIVILQFATTLVSIEILASVRAYVAAESLYSKGQKDALLQLQSYEREHSEANYQRILMALEIPEGDRKARLALLQAAPDWALAREGFLAGQSHSDDVDKMIRMFVFGQNVPVMVRAIMIWGEADDTVAEIRKLVESAHQRVLSGRDTAKIFEQIADRMPNLNERLTGLERDFSEQLGEASRQIQRVLFGLNLFVATALIAMGATYIRKALNAQRQKETEMTQLVHAVGDGLLTVDGELKVVLFNKAAEKIFGCPASDAKGSPIARFIQSGIPVFPRALPANDIDLIHELIGKNTEGQTLHIEASMASMGMLQGTYLIIVCRDVTERKLVRESEHLQQNRRTVELTRKTLTDALTGLPNREGLEHNLNEKVASAQKGGRSFSVLFLDLDGFKSVNDTYGHLEGDELLKQVSNRFRDVLRQRDLVFRVSGDEFVIITDEVGYANLEVLANRILREVRRPFTLLAATAGITVSVGVAQYPENGRDPHSLLLVADASMYKAKNSGKNQYYLGASCKTPNSS